MQNFLHQGGLVDVAGGTAAPSPFLLVLVLLLLVVVLIRPIGGAALERAR